MKFRHHLIFSLTIMSLFSSLSAEWSYAATKPARPIKDTGIISTSASPHAKLHDIPIHAVTLGEGFWKPRLETNQKCSIPALLKELEDHGVVDNFRRLSGRKKVDRRGYLFTDSDLFKWMEAAALVLQSNKDTRLKAALDDIIDEVLAAQGKDGYLNTYHQNGQADKRFTNFRDNHELYCLGHLIQAAIAIYRGSSEHKLLDGARRYADYVMSLFGPGKRQCFPGHPEIEMALMELYRTTGEKGYLDFADYLLNGVDVAKLEQKVSQRDLEYAFSGLPFKSRTELRSHSVRAMYRCCGAADYFLETGDAETWKVLEVLWNDMSQYKMFVTGGVGSRYETEGFGNPYELPNERAYTETCAAIGSIMWNWRMLLATGAARFADLMERALYNGFLSGVSLEGDQYFYRNPLASLSDNERKPWYDCTCCPPNVERMLASLPGHLYSTSAEGIWVHLYHSGELSWRLENGTNLKLSQQTKYPWENTVEIKVEPAGKTDFTLFLRIPDWSPKTGITVNGQPLAEAPTPGSYYTIKRIWKKGDLVQVEFDMPVMAVRANPRLREGLGSVALQRGPIVYCLESPDHQDVSIFDVVLPLNPGRPYQVFTAQFAPELLGVIVVLEKRALAYEPSLMEMPLYGFAEIPRPSRSITMSAIPYYAWANRGKSQMQVWIPWVEEESR